MAFPGFGLPSETTSQPASTSSFEIPAFGEFRLHIPRFSLNTPVTVMLTRGILERDGTELARDVEYRYYGPLRTHFFSWEGASITVTGLVEGVRGELSICETQPNDVPLVAYVQLHLHLDERRKAVYAHGQGQGSGQGAIPTTASRLGPRVLVCGPRHSGKTTVAKTLAAWAAKMGHAPALVNLSPRAAMFAPPGTVAISMVASPPDPETRWGGVAAASEPGPAQRAPLVWFLGRESAGESATTDVLWRRIVARLAGNLDRRAAANPLLAASGVIVDTEALLPWDQQPLWSLLDPSAAQPPPPPPLLPLSSQTSQTEQQHQHQLHGMSLSALAYVIDVLKINCIVFLSPDAASASTKLTAGWGDNFSFQYLKDYINNTYRPCSSTMGSSNSTEPPLSVFDFTPSPGLGAANTAFHELQLESSLKEYFFGDPLRALSPVTQTVLFDQINVFRNTAIDADDDHQNPGDTGHGGRRIGENGECGEGNGASGHTGTSFNGNGNDEGDDDYDPANGVAAPQLMRLLEPLPRLTNHVLALLQQATSSGAAAPSIDQTVNLAPYSDGEKSTVAVEAKPHELEALLTVPVKGFVYVVSVDVEARKLKLLSPAPLNATAAFDSGRKLSFMWGKWPVGGVGLLDL